MKLNLAQANHNFSKYLPLVKQIWGLYTIKVTESSVASRFTNYQLLIKIHIEEPPAVNKVLRNASIPKETSLGPFKIKMIGAN